MARRLLPPLGSMWVDRSDRDRRVRVVAYMPPGAESPAGVEVRVTTSVSANRRTLIPLRDFRENYEQVTPTEENEVIR